MLIRPVTRAVVKSVCRNITRLGQRWALNFDGIGIRGVLANRAINVDGDIDIEFYSPSNFATFYTLISQNISTNAGFIEFRLIAFTSATPVLQLVVGGQVTDILTEVQGLRPNSKYRMTLIGNNLKVYFNGVVIRDYIFTRGSQREPTAKTSIGAQTNGVIDTYYRFFSGIQRDVKINGTLWAISDRNQSIQPSVPAGNNMTISNATSANWVEVSA
jgi:hypothetical protein